MRTYWTELCNLETCVHYIQILQMSMLEKLNSTNILLSLNSEKSI